MPRRIRQIVDGLGAGARVQVDFLGRLDGDVIVEDLARFGRDLVRTDFIEILTGQPEFHVLLAELALEECSEQSLAIYERKQIR